MGKNKQKKKHQQRQNSSHAFSQSRSLNDAGDGQSPKGNSSPGSSPARIQAEASSRSKDTREWQAGDIILDIYEVKGILGEGGMGKVYRVHHKNWNVDLAVKTPRPAILARAGAREDFIREAETWVNLGLHPHTVSCYYVREVDGLPRVFAEYVEGGSLSDWIKTGRLYEGGAERALERILDISIQFAWGLHFAHEQGLIHQDVKPLNVMMTSEGVAKVTDFGLAQVRSLVKEEEAQEYDPTKSVVVAGAGLLTRAYASPEQFTRQPLTRKTDIWSWAVSVFEMFAGGFFWNEGRYIDSSLDDYLDNSHEEDYLADQPKMEIPPLVVNLLRKCFQHDPYERPGHMLEVSDYLQEAYRQVTGKIYPRRKPDAAKAVADSLNNRAASLFDLGKKDEAIELWEEALRVQPKHQEATYNYGLIRWRSGEITDDFLIREIERLQKSVPDDSNVYYLLGLVHLERNDMPAAIKALEVAQNIDGRRADIVEALAAAKAKTGGKIVLQSFFEGRSSEVYWASSTYALTGSHDITSVRLWDVAEGRCIRTFDQLWTPMCLTADGKYILSGTKDNALKLWDTSTDECVRTFEGHTTKVQAISLSSDGKRALSGSGTSLILDLGDQFSEKSLKLWDVMTGDCIRTFEGHAGYVSSVVLSPDGDYALSGSGDRTLKLWDIRTGDCVRTFKGHTAPVLSIALSTDGAYALSGSEDRTLRLWDITTGDCIRTFKGHTSSVDSVRLSADAKRALSLSRYGGKEEIRLWDVTNGRCLYTFENEFGQSTSLSADAKYALTSNYPNVDLWLLEHAEYSAPITISQIVSSEAAVDIEAKVETSLALTREALAAGDPHAALRHTKQARSLPGYNQSPEIMELWSELYVHLPRVAFKGGWLKHTFEGHMDVIYSVNFSGDGRYALSGSRDMTMKLWDTTTGHCIRTFEGHTGYVCDTAISADGNYAVSASVDRTLKLWNVLTGECLRTFEDPYSVRSVRLSGDRKHVLSGSWGMEMRLWDVATGKCLRIFNHDLLPYSRSLLNDGVILALSVDGKYALSGSEENSLRLWDITNSSCIHRFEGHADRINSISFSEDGNHAISGGNGDYALRLWDVTTGQCLRIFDVKTDALSVNFSADGKYALSGSVDKTLSLWDVDSGQCLQVFEEHTGPVYSVALSADCRYALSGSSDNTLKLWQLDWDLEEREVAYWDKGARPFLKNFLTLHIPYAAGLPTDHNPTEEEITLALTRKGMPQWNEDDFQQLLYTLGCAGYGWLHSEGVRAELERMLEQWSEDSFSEQAESLRRTVSKDELASRIHEICQDIEQSGDVWKISAGDYHFIIGPPSIARFYLIDEEYGWPEYVDMDKPFTADELVPGHRRHPLLCVNGRPVAIVLSSGEYEMFKGHADEQAQGASTPPEASLSGEASSPAVEKGDEPGPGTELKVSIETDLLTLEDCLIPADYTVLSIILQLVEELGLSPGDDQGVKTDGYSLLHVNTNISLPLNKRLWESGVKDGDTVRLIASNQPKSGPDGAVSPISREWRAGEIILGRYEIKASLGEGGLSKVYLVHDSVEDKTLAVKRPQTSILENPKSLRLFIESAEAWLKLLPHAHVAKGYDLKGWEGIPLVFCQYVDGGSLSDWIRTRKLYEGSVEKALQRILGISIQLALGLDSVHRQWVVHLNVKPQAVLLSAAGQVKLGGFALAKNCRAEGFNLPPVPVTPAGMTPAYASPEQAAFKPCAYASDIWSWGVTVLEMFTGEVTWMSGALADAVLKGYVEDGNTEAHIPRMPGPLAAVLEKCFRLEPDERWKSIAEVATELRRIYREITGHPYEEAEQNESIEAKAKKAVAQPLEARVARILNLIANPPNLREDPGHPGYLYLFDGGLIRYDTGVTTYEFDDGTRARRPVLPNAGIGITFPDGTHVSVKGDSDAGL